MNGYRLIVITDRQLAAPRSVREVVSAALQGGAPVIELRDKRASAAELYEQARQLLPLVHGHGARLVVNDRLDVALAAGADGVHLGPDDLTVAAARRIAPPDFLIGFSTDHPEDARAAVAAGASYIGCGAVFGTRSKEVGAERIGTARLAELVRSVAVPVVGIGGIDVGNIARVAATQAAGAAVLSAVMTAVDPATVVRQLLAAFEHPAADHAATFRSSS